MSQSYSNRMMTAEKPPALRLLKPFRQFPPAWILTDVTGLLRDQLLDPYFGPIAEEVKAKALEQAVQAIPEIEPSKPRLHLNHAVNDAATPPSRQTDSPSRNRG